MRKVIALVLGFTLVSSMLALDVSAASKVKVKGYTKSNGTYVQGYYRTKQNNTQKDNWTTEQNINPYSGKIGTKKPKK